MFGYRWFLLCLSSCAILQSFSCTDSSFQPKPRAYPRIVYPAGDLVRYSNPVCPFVFDYKSYSTIEKDSLYFGEKSEHDCWFNLHISSLNAFVYCSYYQIENNDNLTKYISDSYRLAREHQKKANFIDEFPLNKDGRVFGMIYNIEGPVASGFQFYLTDSTNHFFRGSLYFNATVSQPDSLQPMLEFVKKDLMELINSFEWTKK